MKKYRLEKLNSMVRKEIAVILQRNVDLEKGTFISVNRADVSTDTSQAKIFISVFPDNLCQKVLNQINNQIYHLQQIFNKRMTLKVVPKLIFTLDNSSKKVQNIYKILH